MVSLIDERDCNVLCQNVRLKDGGINFSFTTVNVHSIAVDIRELSGDAAIE